MHHAEMNLTDGVRFIVDQGDDPVLVRLVDHEFFLDFTGCDRLYRDNLTLADTNEEGANMLMLQTRQNLGTTALSLSSQAAQSVLRLF